MNVYVVAGMAVGVFSALVLGWLGRAARKIMLTAPDMPHRERMLRGARWLPAIIFGVCGLPVSIGLALIRTVPSVGVWLVAAAVMALGALMIAGRFAYWEFAGLGMATPEAIERTESGTVDWGAAMQLARTRERGWVGRWLVPITGLIVVIGSIALTAMVMAGA